MQIRLRRVSKLNRTSTSQSGRSQGCRCRTRSWTSRSGVKRSERLTDALSHLRKGDVLTVWKLDRLGRSTLQLMMLLNDLHERGVEFKSLTEGIDTTTPMGRFYFTMSSALAQLERDRLIERTRAGLAAAKARGRNGGRKPRLTAEQIEMARGLLAGGKPPREVAKAFSVGRTTLYRSLQRIGEVAEAE